MTEDRMALSELLQKSGDSDFLRSVAEAVLQILMEADVEGLIGAGLAVEPQAAGRGAPSSLLTRRWRKGDSNRRSLSEGKCRKGGNLDEVDPSSRGTEGSNPSSSTGESVANLIQIGLRCSPRLGPSFDNLVGAGQDRGGGKSRATLRLIGRGLGERKMPAAANSHEPEPEAENRARNRHRGRRESQCGTDHDHGGAGQCGESVKIGA